MKARGGKPAYGASVGILMLDTRFPRVPGDLGNAATWPFPVHYKVVRNATPDLAVRGDSKEILPRIIDAARDLADLGVDGITTSCGFFSLFQDEISRSVNVPVASSSLMQVALVNATLPPGKKSGILTISGSTLTPAHLAAANVPADTPIGTTEDGREFTRAILENETKLDVNAACEDNVEAALALQRRHPDIGALVLECANMAPYAAFIRAATGLSVYSIYSFVTWFQSGLSPRVFARHSI
ncbi:MAG: aspartate/glutamate racemase family protein [Roseovarius sp.]|nr:aspartate/glutamate racemase family protein [Roseovarius sp.]